VAEELESLCNSFLIVPLILLLVLLQAVAKELESLRNSFLIVPLILLLVLLLVLLQAVAEELESLRSSFLFQTKEKIESLTERTSVSAAAAYAAALGAPSSKVHQ
jgi:hypothetical protein